MTPPAILGKYQALQIKPNMFLPTTFPIGKFIDAIRRKTSDLKTLEDFLIRSLGESSSFDDAGLIARALEKMGELSKRQIETLMKLSLQNRQVVESRAPGVRYFELLKRVERRGAALTTNCTPNAERNFLKHRIPDHPKKVYSHNAPSGGHNYDCNTWIRSEEEVRYSCLRDHLTQDSGDCSVCHRRESHKGICPSAVDALQRTHCQPEGDL
jgi:hypothetical protein